MDVGESSRSALKARARSLSPPKNDIGECTCHLPNYVPYRMDPPISVQRLMEEEYDRRQGMNEEAFVLRRKQESFGQTTPYIETPSYAVAMKKRVKKLLSFGKCKRPLSPQPWYMDMEFNPPQVPQQGYTAWSVRNDYLANLRSNQNFTAQDDDTDGGSPDDSGSSTRWSCWSDLRDSLKSRLSSLNLAKNLSKKAKGKRKGKGKGKAKDSDSSSCSSSDSSIKIRRRHSGASVIDGRRRLRVVNVVSDSDSDGDKKSLEDGRSSLSTSSCTTQIVFFDEPEPSKPPPAPQRRRWRRWLPWRRPQPYDDWDGDSQISCETCRPPDFNRKLPKCPLRRTQSAIRNEERKKIWHIVKPAPPGTPLDLGDQF